MYNGPVYTRFGRVSIPRNYSGNAFTEAEFTDLTPTEVTTSQKSEPISKKLFGGGGNSAYRPSEPKVDSDHHNDECPGDTHGHDQGTEHCTQHNDCTCGHPGNCTCSHRPHPPKDGLFGKLFPSANFRFDFGKLFKNGIGFEEILIIGLILLISQNDKNSSDIIILLALLLFI